MNRNSITKMQKKTLLWLSVAIITTALVSNSTITFAIESTPVVFVEPQTQVAEYRGELITVNVNLADLASNSKLIGAQFGLRYNTSLLKVENVTYGDFLRAYGPTYNVSYVENDSVIAFIMLVPPWHEPFPAGNGTLATITFKTIYPFEGEVTHISTELILYDVILVDNNADPVPCFIRHGIIDFSVPSIAISPDLYTATRKGETISIDVNIKGLNAGWKLVGAQFGLRYNTSLLKVENVTYGDFLRAYGPTYNVSYVENDSVIALSMLMPPWHEPFPAGNGTLATITFKTIYQPTESADMAFGSLKLYNTKLVDENVEQIPYSLTHGEYQIVPVTFRPIDIQVETGVIRFSGEIADFYISITDYGFAINPEMINATLYFNGTVYADLSMMLKSVSKGLYRIVYEIPANAKTGTYVLLVETEYVQVHGTSIKSFQISSTLTGWDAQITETNNNIATIQTSIGIINANLTAINAKLVSINGTVATIDSTVGLIQTSVEAIHLKVVDIDWETRIADIQTSLGAIKGYVMDVNDGGLATINTELGTVKTKVMDTAENVGTSTVLLYIILVLALIAAVVSIISMVYPRKKLT
jgi:hypothetical protein